MDGAHTRDEALRLTADHDPRPSALIHAPVDALPDTLAGAMPDTLDALSSVASQPGYDTSTPAAVTPRGLFDQVAVAIRAMRPKQWSKNGLVLLAMVFARTLTNPPTLGRVALAFLAFSLAASAIYILNDLADRQQDRSHPKKRFRPIASGALSVRGAWVTAGLCAAGALAISVAFLLTPFVGAADHGVDPFALYGGGSVLFVAALVVYVAQNVAYSLWLKHLVLWDVFSIAFGFVLRALAGAFAADVYISPWFYLCTVFLSLFLALGKRRAELTQATASGSLGNTRKILNAYSVQFLDQLIIVVVTCAIMAYSLYTFLGVPNTQQLMVTIPFVLFGLARYLYLVYVKAEGEQPDELLFQDRQILGAVGLCALTVAAILYEPAIVGLIGRAVGR